MVLEERTLIDFIKSLVRDVNESSFHNDSYNVSWNIEINKLNNTFNYEGHVLNGGLKIKIRRDLSEENDDNKINLIIVDLSGNITYVTQVEESKYGPASELFSAANGLINALDNYCSKRLNRRLACSNLGKYQC